MRLILVVLLLLSGTARPVLGQTAEADYRGVFSLDLLGQPRPSAGLAGSFSLAYRGLVPKCGLRAGTGRLWAVRLGLCRGCGYAGAGRGGGA